MTQTAIDIAGGREGGAARFLHELDTYLGKHPVEDLQIVGRDNHLTPRWLIEREFRTRGVDNKIAVNNASFLSGDVRVTLLRNALHFSSEEEFQSLNFKPSRALRAQIPVVQELAKRATTLIVPCTAMAERVARCSPSLSDKIQVRFHPVSLPTLPAAEPAGTILVPIVNSAYKQLDTHVVRLLTALERTGNLDTHVIITDDSRSFSKQVRQSDQVRFIGTMTHINLWQHWSAARAIYYPTSVEAFGYPLAEARASGTPIICRRSDQSAEVAGNAYCGFNSGDQASLDSAVEAAFSAAPTPDAGPFDRDMYFNWLLGTARE